jgi:CheY-like chemotaxis protein
MDLVMPVMGGIESANKIVALQDEFYQELSAEKLRK